MRGANDNASGIAVILGVAEAMAGSPVKPRRSVIFIAIDAKELGLIGSRAYLANPVFPLKKTMDFINLDSVECGDKLLMTSKRLMRVLMEGNAQHFFLNLLSSDQKPIFLVMRLASRL